MSGSPTGTLISLDRILGDAQDGVFVIDRTRRYVLFNEACERITGYEGREVVGRECSCGEAVDCRDKQDRPLWGALCPARGLFLGESHSARQVMRIRRKDGPSKWIETIYTPVRDRDGGVEWVLGVMRDVSQARADEEELLEELSSLREKVSRLSDEQKAAYGFSNIVSKSPAMAPVFHRMRAALGNTSAVLINGESGTGKEVVARTIHVHGLQSAGPFVPLNCSALPRDLIESELFGHVRGSFTGAVQDNKGLLRAAEGGTVFMDEIAQMPLETQAKLLRVLQDKRVRPVGGTSEVSINVRVIAAMNETPREAIAAGLLRQDLFYRLSVISIELPPLRQRREDIPLLVQSFIDLINSTGIRQIKSISASAWRALMSHDWPGNVRELSNVVESAYAMGEGPVLNHEDLSPEVLGLVAASAPAGGVGAELHLDGTLAQVEREVILRALKAANRHRIKAAELMNISRSRLYRRMEALGIDPGDGE